MKITKERRLQLSDEAARLLKDELFNGVLSALTSDYIQALMQTKPGSEDGVNAHAALKALSDIKGRLTALENDGAVLRREIREGRA